MKNERKDRFGENCEAAEKGEGLPVFEPPEAKTFGSGEIRAEIGPAQMCSPTPCPLAP